jgi:LacI family transcriptional regulator
LRVPRKPTLSDVARRAGVSATTASYILNGRSDEMRIAPDTQERVRQAAADLKYRPNPSARSLRTATTRTVGVISDLVAGGQFASQMITGASAAARMLDHFIVIGESQGDPDLEALLIEEMLDRRVDGIVYATLVTEEIKVPKALRHQRAVLLNCVDRSATLPAVVPDEYQGGRSAAAEVMAGGAADGVHVVGERPRAGAIAGGLRLDGLRDGLRALGGGLAGEIACEWAVGPAYDAVDAFLTAGGTPGAMVCLNDRIAMGTYQALAAHGLLVPVDVSVVSFDGSELARWLRPELTSVVLPYAELGARAVELVLDPEARGTGVVRVPMPVSHGGSVRAPADV